MLLSLFAAIILLFMNANCIASMNEYTSNNKLRSTLLTPRPDLPSITQSRSNATKQTDNDKAMKIMWDAVGGITAEEVAELKKSAYDWEGEFTLTDGRKIRHDKNGIIMTCTPPQLEENPVHTDRLYEMHDSHNPFAGYRFILDWESTKDDFVHELIRSGLYIGTSEEQRSYANCANWEGASTLSFYETPITSKYFMYACWGSNKYNTKTLPHGPWRICRYNKFSPPSYAGMCPFMPVRHSVKELRIFGGTSHMDDVEIPVDYFWGALTDGKILRLLHHSSRSEFTRSLERAGVIRYISLVQTVEQENGTLKHYSGFLDITDYVKQKEIEMLREMALMQDEWVEF